MNKLCFSALLFLILSYTGLVVIKIIEQNSNGLGAFFYYLFWIIGIINALLNVSYAYLRKSNIGLIILLILSSVFWILPTLITTVYGFPLLIIYLVSGIYLHVLTR